MVMNVSRRALARWASQQSKTAFIGRRRWVSSSTKVRAAAAAANSQEDVRRGGYYSATALAGLAAVSAATAASTVALMEQAPPQPAENYYNVSDGNVPQEDTPSDNNNVQNPVKDDVSKDVKTTVQATSAAAIASDSIKHIPVGEFDNHPPPRPDLPTIPLEEVADHCDEDSMFFTFRGAVYDLTFFINGHPGGTTRLLMAAGQDLEAYWEVYRQHFRGHVVDWMEKYRIGNLSPEDAEKAKKDVSFGDMYDTDPKRHPDLLSCTQRPFNGEPRIELLTRDYITPNELFYVRNHLAVPEIDPEDYVLIVKGKGIKKHKFTLKDLKEKFPKHEVTTTLQCAGNRREDLHDHEVGKVFIAPHWVVGAISTAKWGGPKLRDVLKHCGLDVDGMALGDVKNDKLKHVQFEGYDIDETGLCYGGSIPIEKAVDGLGDCILAYEMNGVGLPRDHGYPVRAIAPGHAGARQCKWLHKVILSDKESQKSWQQKSYRGFAPNVNFEEDLSHWPPPRLDQAPIVQTMPVQSLVCNPPQNSIVGAKGATSFTVKGVAWSGGGKQINRVDVSIDGGKTWTAAELYKPIEQGYNRHWAWTQFHYTFDLPEAVQEKLRNGEKVELDIVSKAMNSDFNVQPEKMEPYWNARGVAINHWYHVKSTLDPSMDKDAQPTRKAGQEVEFGNTPTGGKFAEHWDMHGWTADEKHKDNVRSVPTQA